MREVTIEIKSLDGWPIAAGTYYECLACGTIIEPFQGKVWRCMCENLDFDYGAARFVVKVPSKLRLFRYSDGPEEEDGPSR